MTPRAKIVELREVIRPQDYTDIQKLALWATARWPSDPAFSTYGHSIATFTARSATNSTDRVLTLRVDHELVGAITLSEDDWGGIAVKNGLRPGRVLRDLMVPEVAHKIIDGLKGWEHLVLAAIEWAAVRGERQVSFFVDVGVPLDEDELIHENWLKSEATLRHGDRSIEMFSGDVIEARMALVNRRNERLQP